MIVILLGIIIILIYIIIHKRNQYKELHNVSIQDKILIATMSEFIVQVSLHSEYEIVNNDMINAVKTCVNKEIYDIKAVDDSYTDDNAYYSFAMQMFNFVDEMDKEWYYASN